MCEVKDYISLLGNYPVKEYILYIFYYNNL
jgi:hypothetical protein